MKNDMTDPSINTVNARAERCILATCCIPWTDDFHLDEKVFRNQLTHIVKHGTPNVYLFGTAGEGYALTRAQFQSIVKVFQDQMDQLGGKPMIGLISLSLQEVIERIEWTRDQGIRSFQISLPSWGPCNWDEVRRFFDETCGRFPGCEFLHYNNQRTRRMIQPEEYALLAERHRNFAATKSGVQSVKDLVMLFRKVPLLRHYITEMGCAQAGLLGLPAGLLVSMGSISWSEVRAFFTACVEGREEVIRKYCRDFSVILEVLNTHITPVAHIDGAYDKIFCKIADPEFPLRLLPPYNSIDDESFKHLTEEIFRQLPHWSPSE
jgi:dihydrodipicolinate synthase/N-acetylneuraminate lyase